MHPRILSNISNHEGRRLRFYLDTKGIVTIGVGHAVFTSADAAVLKMWVAAGVPATPSAIMQDWYLVKSGSVKQGRLFMDAGEVDNLLAGDLHRFTVILHGEFPDIDAYPVAAQVAIYDICYECGSIRPDKWEHLNPAIHARDWKLCAQHCIRGACGKQRNDDTVAQFLEAASV